MLTSVFFLHDLVLACARINVAVLVTVVILLIQLVFRHLFWLIV